MKNNNYYQHNSNPIVSNIDITEEVQKRSEKKISLPTIFVMDLSLIV